KPKPVASINPDKQVFSGDTVTLRCEIQDESVSRWQYSWYKDASLSPVSSVQMYTISSVEVTHTGKYTCKGRESGGSRSSHLSDAVTLTVSERLQAVLSVSPQNWLTEGDSVTLSCEVTDSSTDWTFSWYTVVPYRDGESPPVSLIISPSRTQHFTRDSLSLSCEDQSNSTGWTVRRYTDSEGVLDCSQWGSVTGSTCNISFLSTSYTGVYWCESESGENSNPVNITVHDGGVILDSSVHPVTEGHPLTLHCLYHNTNPSNLRADFYKDGSVVQNQTTGEMIIHKVSKSDEGFYHCKHPERGESPRSWISVRHGEVILDSPVHPVTEGHPLTLHCLYRNTNPSNLRADFYKDGSVVQNQTTGEMIIHKVSKSDEGFYHCKHPERGESQRSWISVRRSTVSGGTVAVAVGLGLLFFAVVILMILLWCCKRKKVITVLNFFLG
ncbi:sialoadhesin, partial [Silurus meridionalis]